MKKHVITLMLFVCLVNWSYGQDTIKPAKEKVYKNELGLDMTPFLKYYLNFSDNSMLLSNNYYLTYRHYFGRGNFRSAIGGNYDYDQKPTPYDEDIREYYERWHETFSLRVGYEFFQNLSRRWQVFYGVDLRGNYYHTKNDAQNHYDDYTEGRELTINSAGVGPVLGLRFRINDRLSILTESTIMLFYSETTDKKYYLQNSWWNPTLPDEPEKKTKALNTSFSSPIAIILTMSL